MVLLSPKQFSCYCYLSLFYNLAGERRLSECVAVLAVVKEALLMVRVEEGTDALLYSDQISSQDPFHRNSMTTLQH